ncbi:glycoside hydrolase family 2 TIM barrel-domain containing protein [Aquimarina addita]|uniref:Glycoside hydrolase family 2 TIM barrel-domain containing protein n=1 Tax=Aquimarina addita TaxID=870485 RepID=A0ABP7XFU1_9FLAO
MKLETKNSQYIWLTNRCAAFFLAIGVMLISVTSFSQTIRTKQNINKGWQYLEENTLNVEDIVNFNSWSTVDIPHSWNSTDVTDLEPGYRRSASWYKKNLTIAAIEQDNVYKLYFEGANITTKVYVNKNLVGEHIGGYIGFETDITKFLKNGNNEVLVRVDNGYNPEIIPSQKSDFFIYGGITRDVWLITKSETNISKVIVNTPTVSKEQATLAVTVNLEGDIASTQLEILATILDPSGKEIAQSKGKANTETVNLKFTTFKKPALWDIDTPNLYTVVVSLLKSGKEMDKTSEKFGFRWFEFTDNGPFYLNGKRVLLRGTHRHEEHAGYGAAMPNELHKKDIQDIKDMGANFIRLAHYPQDPEVYKMCDELGLLVWDEIPWCRGGIGNETWKRNTKNQLTEMIYQNRNHPSIILWSLGNEIYWLPDFKNGDDTEEINIFLKELNALAHQLDPSRKTAIRKYYAGSDIVDVFSPSIWSGWYSGSYKTYEKAVTKYIKEYPHFLHAEYGGSSHIGRHVEKPIDGEGAVDKDSWTEAITQTGVTNIAQIGDWSENYIVDLFDWHLRISETTPDFVGNIQWAMKDFGTPLRPENDIPYMNQKGIMDRAGNPKDAYYVFKSYWAKEAFTYIESHTWTERQGPRDEVRNISVYSNCDEVILYHNGKALEKKKRDINQFPACGLTWDITFKEGLNQLKAIGFKDGKEVTDNLEIKYRYTTNDIAKSLALSYDTLPNGHYLVTAIAEDKNGLRCLDYEDRVYFQCLAGGVTQKHMGTPTGSESIKMANGKAQIEVVPDQTNTPLQMTVLNQSFKGTYLTIEK